MCGIVGFIGTEEAAPILLDGLARLEYRGYDSAGLAVYDQVEGLKVVKAFTHEEQAKDQFRKLNETYRDAAQKANFYSTMIMPVSGNLMNISYALTAAFGGLLSVIQGFDLGGLVVYLNYSKQVGQPLNQISQQMTTLLSAMAGAERIFEVMDTQPEVDRGRITLVQADKDAKAICARAQEPATESLEHAGQAAEAEKTRQKDAIRDQVMELSVALAGRFVERDLNLLDLVMLMEESLSEVK